MPADMNTRRRGLPFSGFSSAFSDAAHKLSKLLSEELQGASDLTTRCFALLSAAGYREYPTPGSLAPSCRNSAPRSWRGGVLTFSDRRAWRECLRDDAQRSRVLRGTRLLPVLQAAAMRGSHRAKTQIRASAG